MRVRSGPRLRNEHGITEIGGGGISLRDEVRPAERA